VAPVGCGEGVTSAGFGLRFTDAAVLSRTSSIAILFYMDEESAEQCTALRTARPRLPADYGPFRQVLDESARRDGTVLPLRIPVGSWAVLVDATGGDGMLVGTGCAQDQVVADRQRSSITLIVDGVP